MPAQRDPNGKFVAQAGIYLDKKGYWCFSAGPNRGKRVHRVLMEEKLGRKLLRSEVVHHRDGNKQNNAKHADGKWNLELLGEREHNSISSKQYWFMRNRERAEEQALQDYFEAGGDEGATGVATVMATTATNVPGVPDEDVSFEYGYGYEYEHEHE